MATQIGNFPFKGRLGSVIGSKRGNKYVIRTYNPINAHRIKHDDAFKRTRENGIGFGGSGRVAKALLRAWEKYNFCATDGTIYSRLNGTIYQIQRKGPGLRGYTGIQLAQFGHELLGFDLAKDRKVATAITGTPNWDYDPNTGKIRLWMPQNATIHRTMAPATATHTTLRLMVDIISDYEYHPPTGEEKKGEFLPVTEENHTSGAAIESPHIPLTAAGADISGVLLEMELPYAIQPHQSMVITWGVAYWDFNAEGTGMINRNQGQRRKPLQEGAMQVLTVHATDKPRHSTDPDPLQISAIPTVTQPRTWDPGQPETTVHKTQNTLIIHQNRLQTIHDQVP